MKRTKSQLNAIYYFHRGQLERRLTAGEALYGRLNPVTDLSEDADFWLEYSIKDGCCGEFVRTTGGFCEARHAIRWDAVRAIPRYAIQYILFERYRAAVRAQKSPYYRRRLAKLGIDWKTVKRPYGTEAIELD